MYKISTMAEKIAILRRYNFWDKEMPDVGFPRHFYLNKIKAFTGNRLIKVLVGQRRVGKSYLLRQIIKSLITGGVSPENILYVNMEFVDFDFISNYKDLKALIDLYKSELKPEGKIYIFIDEIQNIERWEYLINSYSQDYTQDIEIFITGSNSKLLSGELATLLSGRYIRFEVYPFSYKEFVEFRKLRKNKENYIRYLQSSGLPELYNLPDEEAKRHYVLSLIDTILLRDIIQRYRVKNPVLLLDIFTFLVNNASNLISINKIVNYFNSKNRKTNYETVSNYIEYLKDAFLIYRANRYNIKGKEILSGSSKFYINDLAYKNYLYSGFGYGIGYMLENLIFLDLKRHEFDVFTGYMRNKEIDFVALKNDRVIYIQVSYLLQNEETKEREYSPLQKIQDNYEKYVVTLDDIQFPGKNGIKHIRAWEFEKYLNEKIC